MQRRLTRISLALLPALLLTGISFADVSKASAQLAESPSLIRIPPAANREQREIDDVLREGMQLEGEDRWREAMQVYENGFRRFHHDQIKRRLDVARMRFDFERRYHDQGYLQMIEVEGSRVASSVLSEVLLKIDAYHVDRPNWAEIARHGVNSLSLAISQPSFREHAMPANSRVDTETMIGEIDRLFHSRAFINRHDLHAFVTDIDATLRQRWGVASAPIYYEFACAGLSSLDWYSSFLTADQYDEVISQIDGNFVGLGIELQPQPEFLEVVNVIGNGPAGEAGMRGGDRIVGIDSVAVSEIGGDAAADRLRGPEGSLVDLVIDPVNGERQTIRIRRRRVEIPSLERIEIVDEQNGVGYIHLSSFQRTTGDEFRNALWQLHRQGMRSLIVDVRGNPGGLLDASVDVANLFLTQGTIVSTRGRNPKEDRNRSAHFDGTWQVPLTVLIDSNSASASEIFAGAIRDHKRGTLIGEKSYGKGSVQGIFPLNSNGGGMRLTTAKFFSPVGQAISIQGVNPDIEVQASNRPDFVNASTDSEDAVLSTAIRYSANSQNQPR